MIEVHAIIIAMKENVLEIDLEGGDYLQIGASEGLYSLGEW